MGKPQAEEQVQELLHVQVGKNVTSVTNKAIANWCVPGRTHTHTHRARKPASRRRRIRYYTKYYPDVEKPKPQGLKFSEAKQ